MTAIATVSADGTVVQVRKGAWSMTFPTENLPAWIAFYRRMASRKHPRFGGEPFAPSYRDVLAALEKASRIAQAYDMPAETMGGALDGQVDHSGHTDARKPRRPLSGQKMGVCE